MMYMCNTGSMRKTILWETATPSSLQSFPAGDVYLADAYNNYDFISVVFASSTSVNNYIEIIVPIENLLLYGSGTIPSVSYSDLYMGSHARCFYANDLGVYDTIHFTDNVKIGGTGTANGSLIPVKVYGINI
mgnify:CR=1 FL=1